MKPFQFGSSVIQRRGHRYCPDGKFIEKSGNIERKQLFRHAFTLAELMVAMAVLSIMILFLFAVFNQATRAWQASEKKADAFREARAALYIMRRDILGVNVGTNLPISLNAAGINFSVSGMLKSTNSLFFVSAEPSDAQGGASLENLCTVGYYVAWSTNEYKPAASSATDVGISRSYNLFRYFRDGNETYTNMGKYWKALAGSTDLASQMPLLFPGVTSNPLNGDEVLARNVLAFSVTPYVRGATLPATEVTGPLTSRPTYIDIVLSVINYATAAQLGDTAGSDSNWKVNTAPPYIQNLVKKNQQDFYSRIPLSK